MKFTRVLALLLTVTMLFTGMVLPTVAEDGEEEEEYTPVYTIEDLYCIRYDLDGNFKLMNDIDMTADVAEGGDWDGGHGWDPIGAGESTAFTGTFDGQGYTITGLRIADPVSGCTGLFGYLNGGTVKNFTLDTVEIESARQYVGAAVGYCKNSSTVSGITVTNASLSANSEYAGGIVGCAESSSVSDCHYTGSVVNASTSNFSATGGVLGRLNGSESVHGRIDSSSFNGTVSGGRSAGGIVGYMGIYTDASQCYASGSVTGTERAGGIVGCTEGSGHNDWSASITVCNCYNLASVSAFQIAGGIVGNVNSDGHYGGYNNGYHEYYSRITVSQSFNIGTTLSEGQSGAIIGKKKIDDSRYGPVTVTSNYYLRGTADSGVYGDADTATTCVALTAAQSRLKAVYGYFDFENVWFFDKSTGIEHPQLRSNPEPPLPPFELVITRLPDSLVCLEGEAPDLTGGQVQCVGLAGDPLLDMTADMISDFDSTHYGVQTVTLYYSGQEVSFTLTVEHNYENIPVPATCLMSGYTMHTCRGCGHQEVTDLTVANGHSFGDWALAGNGFVTRSCANCDEVETEKLSDESVGDINGDGFLSIRDVSLLLMMISG